MSEANFSLRVLAPGPFRRYIAGESVAMTGTWMQMMAQGYVVTTLTTSAFTLGLLNFAGGVPMLLLTMWAGVVADRHDKRKILIGALVVQMAIALAAGFLIATGQIQLWHIFTFAIILGVSGAFEMPAAAAMVPELVEKELIKDAIALDRSVFHGTRLIGPAFAGGLVAAWGAATAFFINAVTPLALIGALLTIPKRAAGTPEEEEARQTGGMGEGIAYVRRDAPTRAMILLMMLMTVFVFPLLIVLMPLYATHTLKAGPAGMGLLMAVGGAGSLAASLGLLAVPRDKRRAGLGLAAAGTGAALVALASAPSVWLAAPALLVLSMGTSAIFGLGNTIVQERAPDHLRGRVSAVAGMSFFGLMPFAGLATSALADVIGMRTELAVSAVVFTIGAAVLILGPGGKTLMPPAPEAPAEAA